MLKNLVFSLIFYHFSSTYVFAQFAIDHPDLVKQRNCFSGPVEEYDLWFKMLEKKNSQRAKTEQELANRMDRLKQHFSQADFYEYKESIECIDFTYKVDDLLVDGYLIKPKNRTNLPVLIYNRGGNGRFGAVVFAKQMSSLFPVAKQGFAIIGSQYRGAFDKEVVKGKYDEFGGADVADVVKLIEFIPHIQGVDSNRIGMYGSSRGGMQTFLALKQLSAVKAVAIVAGVSDLEKRLPFRPEMENVYKRRIPNYTINKTEELHNRSVLKWVEQLDKNVPILIQHGDQDTKVNVENAEWLADSLAELNHPYKLSIYGGEGHGWSVRTKPLATKELTDWFHHHL